MRQIKTAEKVGYDSVWFEEHHEHAGYLPAPIHALAAVSMHTKLRLGTNVVILPLHNPFSLAEEIAQLDCISHGRVILGFAIGYRDKDFRNFGVKLQDRARLMDEGLTIVDRLLTSENVSFTGEFFNVSEASIQPRAFQKPRPPIWIGGWKKPALTRAAKMGDAWFPGSTGSLPDVVSAKQIYDQELSKLGKKATDAPIMRDMYIAETDEKAIKECESSFHHMYQEDYSSSGHPIIGGKELSFEDWARDRFLVGSPDTMIKEVEKYRKAGFNYIVLRASLKRLSADQINASIKLFGEKVIPHFSNDEN